MQTTRINGFGATKIMLSVIYALMLRETATRYGRLQISYLWAFVEPILFVMVISIVFIYIRQRDFDGMPVVQFIATGILSFFLFRNIFTQTMLAIHPNRQLLFFPQVQVFDLGVARALLEYATFWIVFPSVIFLISFSGIEVIEFGDPLGILVASAMLALLGFGMGTAVGALIPLFPSLQYLAQIVIMRPMFLLSGVFFTVEMIPETFQPYALLNPVLQLVEMFRSAYFPDYESNYINYPYLIIVILLSIFFGLLIQRALRRYAFQP